LELAAGRDPLVPGLREMPVVRYRDDLYYSEKPVLMMAWITPSLPGFLECKFHDFADFQG
jgi:hypothetical protein